MKFRIKLKAAHDKTGLTFYAVAKQTGIASNTVQKYADVDVVISDYIPTTVIRLAQFYGVDWRDPSVLRSSRKPKKKNQTPFSHLLEPGAKKGGPLSRDIFASLGAG